MCLVFEFPARHGGPAVQKRETLQHRLSVQEESRTAEIAQIAGGCRGGFSSCGTTTVQSYFSFCGLSDENCGLSSVEKVVASPWPYG